MSFRITALDPAPFASLFSLGDEELKAHNAVRVTATKKPGFPCRVSLADAEVGDELVLLHYEHQPAETPFKAGHAIYVRKDVEQVHPAIDEVPDVFRTRVLSLRAFNAEHMMIAADLVEGVHLEEAIGRLLGDSAAAYLHIHNAKQGCYFARADRA